MRIIEALKVALRMDDKEVLSWRVRAKTARTEKFIATTDAENILTGTMNLSGRKKN